jgi:hypothetical protein
MSDKKDIKPSAEKSGENIPQKKKKGKTVKQLSDKHMKDKTHIITDEEIKNLDLDLNNPETNTSHTPDIPDDKDRPKDEDKDPKIITPWDVIKE